MNTSIFHLIQESSEEVKHDFIANAQIHYSLKPSTLTQTQELKYYTKIYELKTLLANREVCLHIHDDDLIQLNNQTGSVHIKLVTYKQPMSIPVDNLTQSAPTSARASPKGKSKMIKQKSKSTDNNQLNKQKQQLVIVNQSILCHYVATMAKYDTFKFQLSRGELKCYGVMDNKQNCTALLQQGYRVQSGIVNDNHYDIIYKLPIDFVSPMYVSQIHHTTIETLFLTLSDVLKILII